MGATPGEPGSPRQQVEAGMQDGVHFSWVATLSHRAQLGPTRVVLTPSKGSASDDLVALHQAAFPVGSITSSLTTLRTKFLVHYPSESTVRWHPSQKTIQVH